MLKLEAYERFKESLLSGKLEPGQFVTQKELANIAEVPLGSIREAIQVLERDELLKVYPQRGIQITDISFKLIRSAYQFRIILETWAVRYFAENVPDATIDGLIKETQTIIDKSEEGITPQLQAEAVEVDWKMHDMIIDFAKNDILSNNYRINSTKIRLIRLSNTLSDDRLIPALREHILILNACKERNPEKASKLLEDHLLTSQRRAESGN